MWLHGGRSRRRGTLRLAHPPPKLTLGVTRASTHANGAAGAHPCPRRYIPSPTSHPTGAPMTASHRPPQEPADPEGAARFRRTLARVMSMQVAALVVLWWLQARYGN